MNASGPGFALGLILATCLSVTSCDGCRRNHPFIPFLVASASTPTGTHSAAPSGAPLDALDPSPAPSTSYPIEGERLPADSRQAKVGVRQIEAPRSAVFEAILRSDWNGDGALDAVALLRSTAPDSPSVGAIYLYDGRGDVKRLSDLPGWLPSHKDCTWQPRLQQVGANTVAIDLHLSCAMRMPSRSATRYLALIAPTRSEPLLAAWRMAEPAPDERFDATLSGADLDGDGKDDATLKVSLMHIPTKREVFAEFVWLDRTAGISREPGHFANSLGPTLASLEKQAANRKSAAEALERAAAVWRLLASTCADSATARLFRADGAAMDCESIASSIGHLVGAEVRAALSQNDVLRAAFAITRSEFMFGFRPSATDRTNWLKLLRKSMAPVEAIDRVASEVKPSLPRSSVHFSPLHYDMDGTLLIQTPHGVARVNPNGQEASEDDASTAPASWPLEVSSPGRTLENILAACDRSELLVAYKAADGRLLQPIPTAFLAPRPGVCGGAASVNWRVSPISLTEDPLPVALVEGACIASSSAAESCLKPAALGKVVVGSPRSPDGRRLIAATGVGLIAIGGPKPELWASDTIGNPATLSDCVIDNSGIHVACIQGARLVLLSKAAGAAHPEP
jgi:hypothetical protein